MPDQTQPATPPPDVQDLYRLSRDELVRHVVDLHAEAAGLRETLQLQQITDTLTGLANRDYFFASLGRLCRRAKRFGQIVCVALIDIDNFRLINEQYGHLAGDLVLTGLADLLRSVVRDYDLLARFGEDEFAVAIDNGDMRTARQLGERIQKIVVENPLCASDRIVTVTVTIGLAVAHPEVLEDKPETLVRSAIEAAEIASRKGHNQLHAVELTGRSPKGIVQPV